MKNMHSSYKKGSIILALFVNIALVYLTGLLIFSVTGNIISGRWDGNFVIIFITLLLLFMTSLTLRILMVDARYIIANEEYILFINPILPFIRKRVYWTDYDCYYHVKERSQYDNYKTIWLVKDGKVKDRISSFYYKNYSKIKATAAKHVSGKGILRMSNFTQISCILLRRRLPDID